MSIYKACDIRGVAGKELTPELYRRLGRGLARMMGERRAIVVGGDLRPSTPTLKDALTAGLQEEGRAVADVGLAPTPLVYFARHHRNADACAIVTASHNPPEFNGLKFMIGDLPVLPEDLQRLRALAEDADAASRSPSMSASSLPVEDCVAAYQEWILREAARWMPADLRVRPRRVVVDAGNGSFWRIAPEAIARDGAEVVRLFCEPDGTFPNRSPNCAMPSNLTALCRRVRETGADAGAAFDGDGDRVAFVDETGAVLDADEVFVILLRALGDRLRGEKVVYDLKCSRVVAAEAEARGARALMERSGHAFIKRRMILEDALLGGEVSGHFFHRALRGGDDGLFTALVALRLLSARGTPLSALRQALPQRFITPDIRLPWSPEKTGALLDRVRASFPAGDISDMDGIRVAFPDGWALLRASITEPKVTLRFEGKDAASLRGVVEAFAAAVPELRSSIEEACRACAAFAS